MKPFLSLVCSFLIFGSFRAAEMQAQLKPADVTLDNVKIIGNLSGDQGQFTLTATAHVEESKGASLELLSGAIALTEIGSHPQWHIQAASNKYALVFDHRGKFPLQIKFNAAV